MLYTDYTKYEIRLKKVITYTISNHKCINPLARTYASPSITTISCAGVVHDTIFYRLYFYKPRVLFASLITAFNAHSRTSLLSRDAALLTKS